MKAYPIVERHRYLWIWMGDPKLADESEIPDFSRIDDPAYGTSNIKFRHDAHVQLLIDNLMDLSHLAYVHSTTTGSPQIAELAEVETTRDGNSVNVKRWMEDVPAPRTHREFGGYNGNMDSWQVSEFSPPTYVRVSYGSRGTGNGVPDADWFDDQGHWGFYVFHGLTPETEMTAHQFRYIAFHKGIGKTRNKPRNSFANATRSSPKTRWCFRSSSAPSTTIRSKPVLGILTNACAWSTMAASCSRDRSSKIYWRSRPQKTNARRVRNPANGQPRVNILTREPRCF